MEDLNSCALVLVDLQNDFLAKGGFYDRKEMYTKKVRQKQVNNEELKNLLSEPSSATEQGFKFRKPSLNKTIKNIQNVIGSAIKNEMLVVCLKAVYSHNYEIKPPIFRKNPDRLDYPCKPGTWGAEFIEPIKNLPFEIEIIEKHTFDGFFKTGLAEFLRSHKIRTVLIAGVETHICVLSTAQSASLNQFTTIILEDCVSSVRNDLAECALKIFHDGFGDVKLSTDIFPNLSVLN